MLSQFKFSIIMAIHNSDNYLDEAIQSVTNQTLDFEDNVELILVDDGSTDSSRKIIREYQQKYPENITVLYQENMGQSSAHNYGLKYIKGEYVNFLDSDDYISENTLENVYNFFKEHENTTIATIPVRYTDRSNKNHELSYEFNNNEIIDLNSNPNNPIVSTASTFFRHDSIKEIRFDEDLQFLEDALFTNKILLENRKVGLVNSATYYYRKYFTLTAITDCIPFKIDYYTTVLENYYINLINHCINKYNEIPLFIQYTLAYQIQDLLKIEDINIFEDENGLDKFWNNLNFILDNIDEEVFVNNRNINNNIISFALFLKNNQQYNKVTSNNEVTLNTGKYNIDTLNKHTLYLYSIEVTNGFLNIFGFINSNFPINFYNIKLVEKQENDKNKEYTCEYFESHENNMKNKQLLSIDWNYYYNFKVSIPVEDIRDNEYYFKIYVDKHSYKVNTKVSTRILAPNRNTLTINNAYSIVFENNYFTIYSLDKIINDNNNQPKVSIIIPVYNVEDYLPKCLDSVMNQTLKDIEIICIDDGSTDNSLKILKSYASKDKRIKIISKENEGQAIARNIGMSEAKGEYIGFVDSDDFIDSKMFEKLYVKSIMEDLDILMCKISTYNNVTKQLNNNIWYYSLRVFNDNHFDENVFNHLDTKEFTQYISVTPINKLYKREFLVNNGFKFPEHLIFEDEVFFYDIYLKAKRVSLLKENLYFYRVNRKGSTVSSSLNKDYTDIITVFKLIREIITKNNLLDVYKISVYNRFFHLVLMRYSETSVTNRNNFWLAMKNDFNHIITYDKEESLVSDKIFIDDIDEVLKSRVSKVLKYDNYEDFSKEDSEKEFSIILPSNSEKYLRTTVDSIIEQTIRFQHNVELILFGSSSAIHEFKRNFPDNVVIIPSNSCNRLELYNLALDKVHGKYVCFLKEGDSFTQNTLKNVKKFFDENESVTDVVTIPIKYNGNLTDNYELNYDVDENKVINLNKEEHSPRLSVYGMFIKNSSIGTLRFNTDLQVLSDTLFINQILLKNRKIGFQRENTYYFNINENTTSNSLQIDDIYYNEFLNNCKLFNNFNENNQLPVFIQNSLLYVLEKIVTQYDVNYLDNFNMDKIYRKIRELLNLIDFSTLSGNNMIERNIKSYFLYLVNDNHFNIEQRGLNSVSLWINDQMIDNLFSHPLYIDSINILNGILNITGSLVSLFNNENITIYLVMMTDNEIINRYECSYFETSDNSRKTLKLLNESWKYYYNFNVEIPLNMENYLFHFEVNYKDNENDVTYSPNIKFTSRTQFSDKEKEIITDRFIVSYENNKIRISKKYVYLFSVVMAVFNTEDYLHQAIDSIIDQTIDFKENVQLILINDGSTDSSEDILHEYKEKYPDNIVVLSQKNSGQSCARNLGLEFVQGKYVNFLDSDDYLSENTFEEVYNFFEKHQYEIDLVSIPIKFFEKQTGNHILNDKFTSTRVIDLNKQPNNPQLSISSSFIKNNALQNFKFLTNINVSEDSILINQILLEKKKYGVVNDAIYYYRKRESSISTMDSAATNKDYFTYRLKNAFLKMLEYTLFKEENIPRFIQFYITYDLQWLTSQHEILLSNKLEFEEFWYCLNIVLNYIDFNVIQNNKRVRNYDKSYFLYYLKNDENYTYTVEGNNVTLKIRNDVLDNLKVHKLWLDIIELKDNYLYISGFFNSFFNRDLISIVAVKESKNKKENIIGKYVKYNARDDEVYLSKKWKYMYNFDLKIPLNHNENCNVKLNVIYHIDGDNMNYVDDNIIVYDLIVDFRGYANLSNISNYFTNDDYIVCFENNAFTVKNYSSKLLLKQEKNTIKDISSKKDNNHKSIILTHIVYLALYYLFRIFRKNKEIYIFMDRQDHADDNAEHLYKYALKQNDNVKKYFALNKNSNDYDRLSYLGNIVAFGSFKHKILYLLANKVISSHPDENILDPFFKDKRYYAGLITSSKYFLQHGVTKGNVSSWLKKYDKNLSLIVTVSDLEHDSFLDEGYNYDESIIQTLGFPRYDKLDINNTQKKKQILFTPTWRNYISNSDQLINTEYFKRLNSFLSDKKLIREAEKLGYSIVFRPHPNMMQYIDLFDIDEHIIISKDESYNTLFNESSILITDYSSVFFDFAYLKKPVIYYQYGNDYHFEEGYFKYKTVGFGDVIETEDDLVNKIIYYMNNDCEMEDKYKNRVDKFFKYRDTNNCKRVYDWIKEN